MNTIKHNPYLLSVWLQHATLPCTTDAEKKQILEWAIQANTTLIKEMLQTDEHINYQFEVGITPLHVAASVGDLHIVKTLINKQTNVIALANDQETPLDKAITNNYSKTAKELITNKATVAVLEEYTTHLLHTAAMRGRAQIVKILLKNDATIVNIQDDKGNTRLHYAVINAPKEVIKILLKHHADKHIANSSGIAPANLAHKKLSLPILDQLTINDKEENSSLKKGAYNK